VAQAINIKVLVTYKRPGVGRDSGSLLESTLFLSQQKMERGHGTGNSHFSGNDYLLFTFQIIPLRRESLSSPVVAVDIGSATDFFRFLPSSNVEFRRELTVKLPLPLSPDDDQKISADDVAVCQTRASQDGDEWTVLDGPLKLTRNSVAFDTRTLSK